MGEWRERSRQVIAEVMASVPADATLPQARRLLREAYPFGERAMHPYKVWCSEQRKAINQWRKKDEERKPDPHGAKCGVRMSLLKSGHPCLILSARGARGRWQAGVWFACAIMRQ